MKKTFIVFFLATILSVASTISCNPDPVNVKWAEGNLTSIQVKKDKSGIYNFHRIRDYYGDTGIVYTGEMGLHLDLSVERLIAQFRRPQLIKSANAFSFNVHYILQNNVDSIKVITLRDFDRNHLKNSVVNDLIVVVNGDSSSSIEHVIANNSELNYGETFSDKGYGSSFEFYMHFTKDPELDNIVQFVTHVYCSDNVEIVDSSQMVHIY